MAARRRSSARTKTRARAKPARRKARTAGPAKTPATRPPPGGPVHKPARRRAGALAGQPAPQAEGILLALARDLTERGHHAATPEQFQSLVVHAFAAYGPETPLAAALREDWLRGRGDKSAGLALGWAREQVRLALAETLARARDARLVRRDTDVETLAWLWLAACEALAHEVPGAAQDRVQAFGAFLAAA